MANVHRSNGAISSLESTYVHTLSLSGVFTAMITCTRTPLYHIQNAIYTFDTVFVSSSAFDLMNLNLYVQGTRRCLMFFTSSGTRSQRLFKYTDPYDAIHFSSISYWTGERVCVYVKYKNWRERARGTHKHFRCLKERKLNRMALLAALKLQYPYSFRENEMKRRIFGYACHNTNTMRWNKKQKHSFLWSQRRFVYAKQMRSRLDGSATRTSCVHLHESMPCQFKCVAK